MNKMRNVLLSGLLLLLLPWSVIAAVNSWSGTGPFATGAGNQIINAMAVSPDGQTVYAGTGSGTVLSYVYPISNQATLSVTGPASVTYGSTGTLTSSGGSGGGAVTYSAGGSTGCSVSGSTLSVTNASNACAVTASKAADGSYSAATSAPYTVTLNKASQSAVTLTSTSGSFGTPLTLSANGGSGTGAYSFAVNSTGTAGCSITGGGTTLTASTAGSCTVIATRVADNNYNAAASSATSVTINAASTYSVTYNGNTGTGGNVPTDGATYANGASVTVLGNTGTLVKPGYTFNGWNTAANGSGTGYVATNTFAIAASTTLYAQWTATPVEPTTKPITKPIPTVIPPPPVAGVGGNQLNPLNLSSGDGPAMTTCLRDQLRTVMGANAVYQGQTADGGARIGATGLIVSFYTLDATTSTSNGLGQGAGIYLRGSNPLNVVTSCGTFTTVPAIYNLTEWGAFLDGMGLSAQFNTQGVMTVVVDGTTYVAHPDYSVTQGEPGAPRLVTGADGLMRFTDSAGNVQILYPAFIDPETLVNQVAQAVGGSTVIQTDGTALVTVLNGQKFVLTPDMTLGTVPPEQLAAGWWQVGPDHYRYRNSSFSPTSQGFTVRPQP
jgi:uncharacterized repeat protein (TIGR02543 family)